MISDRIITFLPIHVGVFCFTVFCIYRRRLNRMNPSQRQGKKAKMEAWLEGQTVGARLYRWSILILGICTVAHMIMSGMMRAEARDKYRKSGGRVVAFISKPKGNSSGKRYTIELYNGSDSPIWVNKKDCVNLSNEPEVNEEHVVDNVRGSSSPERLKPLQSLYITIPADSFASNSMVSIHYSLDEKQTIVKEADVPNSPQVLAPDWGDPLSSPPTSATLSP